MDLKQYEQEFNEMELFYAPVQENIIETLKRLGYGVITLSKDGDDEEFIIKQLSWRMSEKQSLEAIKSVFNAFEIDLSESVDNFNIYTYCEKLSEHIYKITFTTECKEVDIFNEDLIYYNSY